MIAASASNVVVPLFAPAAGGALGLASLMLTLPSGVTASTIEVDGVQVYGSLASGTPINFISLFGDLVYSFTSISLVASNTNSAVATITPAAYGYSWTEYLSESLPSALA